MSASPIISVVMSVYNGEKYLTEAIESILNQTFRRFEFIIIDDASSDDTVSIIKKFQEKDGRIVFLRNDKNLKLPRSLNKGLSVAKGQFIARMDADDVSLPTRFENQLALMLNSPEIDICGSWLEVYEDPFCRYLQPEGDAQIKSKMFFETSVAHPTVFFKRDLFFKSGGYDPLATDAEDFDFWERLAHDYKAVFSNIQKILLRYRIHPGVARTDYRMQQASTTECVLFRQVKRLGLEPTSYEKGLHRSLADKRGVGSNSELKECAIWLDKLLVANEKSCLFDTSAFRKELDYRWLRVCRGTAGKSLRVIPTYLKNKIEKYSFCDCIVIALMCCSRGKYLVKNAFKNKNRYEK